MNHAALTSPRLQRVLRVLKDGRRHTTRDIVRRANVCAVNSCIAELREHGAEIICQHEKVQGGRRFYYTMTKAPKNA